MGVEHTLHMMRCTDLQLLLSALILLHFDDLGCTLMINVAHQHVHVDSSRSRVFGVEAWLRHHGNQMWAQATWIANAELHCPNDLHGMAP
jgi:hypothetical protein